MPDSRECVPWRMPQYLGREWTLRCGRILRRVPGPLALCVSTNGKLLLVDGSTLPAKGTGQLLAQMEAELSPSTSAHIVPHLMTDLEVPLFLELQFDVLVGIGIGSRELGTSAPFFKKCGMNLAGVLVNTDRRLGPLMCRDSFAQLDGILPHAGEAVPGSMSFSAAQMDPDRVMLGEWAKNISIVGIGSLCFFFGFWFTFLETNPCEVVKTYKQVETPEVVGRMRSAFNQAVGALPHLPGRGAAVPNSTADLRQGGAGAAGSFRSILNWISCGCARGGLGPVPTATPAQPLPTWGPSRLQGYFGRVPAAPGGHEATNQATSRLLAGSSRLLAAA